MPLPGEQHRGIANPFQEEDEKPRISEWSAKQVATLQSRLNKQLGPEFIASRKGAGGRNVSYLPAEKAINLANDVFGFNGWNSSVRDVTVDFVDVSQSSGRISMGISVVIRVTLKDGAFHEDIGYGSIENCPSKAQAFEKAKKEASTDALKRALRTFGNMLGNCLYDKHYEGKVSKMKVPPPKWDTDSLHRHRDYAVVKTEKSKPSVTPAVPHRTLPAGEQSNLSNATDPDDEFGGNLFDGMDFDRPNVDDDDSAYESMLMETTGAKPNNQPNAAQQLQGPSRAHSLPQLGKGTNVPPQNQQHQPHRPQFNVRGPNAPNGNGAAGPDQQQQPSRPQPHQQAPSTSADLLAQKLQKARSTPPNGADTNGADAAQQQQAPQDAPVGFVTGRAADLLQKATAGRPPGNVAPFNPHAESPSLRRTSGIDHNRSMPVARTAISGSTTNGNGNGTAAAGGKPDFVNPQANANRRIGMPGAAQSPLANRSTYRPPGPAVGAKRAAPLDSGAARPPLSDMSNLQPDGSSTAESVESKRARLNGGS
ncbi:uncharacterized protein K452DRAFT_249472 [Aplosporella prunicola CBS 121167]|uniref:RAD52 homolog n=1 Tax=Aplosporella prunicola CBS 121167 TaxID=1176127 RepID=A0A6A6BEP0_9PEZI|nr:uncharacterized protein K452DRAFT_249472 [Aplosporella prunicola CBS 121167]KAF2142620.1 hypothetical protein K452DRAFT_249472 [Aplosporella prunicola CBS 121167]